MNLPMFFIWGIWFKQLLCIKMFLLKQPLKIKQLSIFLFTLLYFLSSFCLFSQNLKRQMIHFVVMLCKHMYNYLSSLSFLKNAYNCFYLCPVHTKLLMHVVKPKWQGIEICLFSMLYTTNVILRLFFFTYLEWMSGLPQ